jgi:TetR/AcrR family transcriptional regulator, transcriptional repressor for nem operon
VTLPPQGAIYRHFSSKAALEKATLFHLSSLMFEKLRARIKCETTAGNKLRAIFRYYESYVTRPELKGGCPLMNAAIEADDSNPVLRKEAVKVLDILRDSVTTILKNGIRYKQIKKETDLEFYSTLIIASLEGAIMMSKLRGDNQDIRRVIRHLEIQVKNIET